MNIEYLFLLQTPNRGSCLTNHFLTPDNWFVKTRTRAVDYFDPRDPDSYRDEKLFFFQTPILQQPLLHDVIHIIPVVMSRICFLAKCLV
jgi:hypothetical protein